MTEGIELSSDDLEVALQLPLRHGSLELAAFPLAGTHVVVDERVAQELADLLAARERSVAARSVGGSGSAFAS